MLFAIELVCFLDDDDDDDDDDGSVAPLCFPSPLFSFSFVGAALSVFGTGLLKYFRSGEAGRGGLPPKCELALLFDLLLDLLPDFFEEEEVVGFFRGSVCGVVNGLKSDGSSFSPEV